MRRDDEFTAYVAARARLLRRSAYLLCGDWHRARTLTQSALTKVYLAWSRVRRADNVDGYVRQVPGPDVPGRTAAAVATGAADRRDARRAAAPTRRRPATSGSTCCGRWPRCRPGSARRWCCAAGGPADHRGGPGAGLQRGHREEPDVRGLAALRGVLAPGRYDGQPEGACR